MKRLEPISHKKPDNMFRPDHYRIPSITSAQIQMLSFGSVNDPPVKYKPVIDAEVLASVAPETLNDSYVYVHCYFQNQWKDALVRIWKTTFLVDKVSGVRSGLIHAENISIAPLWTLIPDNSMHTFLLVFAALPKSCKQFDLVEDIPQPGGFHVTDIFRNQQDVYHIDL